MVAVLADNDKHVVVPHLVEQPSQFGSVDRTDGPLVLSVLPTNTVGEFAELPKVKPVCES